MEKQKIKLNFLFHPYNPVSKAVTDDGGQNTYESTDKKRYLVGITSGMSQDYHGDRMSKDCIQDMPKQAIEKDITLYANHNKDYNKAIGILENSKVTDDGEFYTEYRLWDNDDEVPTQEKEDADHIWRMINGIMPYKKKRQFGFSIEGYVDLESIEKTGQGRIIHKVDLDPGVSLVSKPAYQYSVASAIMKSIDSQMKKSILDITMDSEKNKQEFYSDRWEIEDAFNQTLMSILDSEREPSDKTALLDELFDDYKGKMMSLYSRTGYKRPETDIVSSIASSPGLLKAFNGAVHVLKAINKKIPKEGKR